MSKRKTPERRNRTEWVDDGFTDNQPLWESIVRTALELAAAITFAVGLFIGAVLF